MVQTEPVQLVKVLLPCGRCWEFPSSTVATGRMVYGPVSTSYEVQSTADPYGDHRVVENFVRLMVGRVRIPYWMLRSIHVRTSRSIRQAYNLA